MLQEIFMREKDLLQKTIAAAPAPAAVRDALQAFFGRAQAAYIADESDPAQRALAASLFALAKSASATLANMTETKVYMELPASGNAGKSPARALLRFLPLLLSAATAVVLYIMQDNLLFTMLALASAIASLMQVLVQPAPAAALPEARAEVRADARSMVATVEHICLTMDKILAEKSEKEQLRRSRLVWTQPQLSAVQALWEASHTADSEYALKNIPALLHALEQEGLEILSYSQEKAEYFEPQPGATGGVTIRPALLQGKRLLARGQVTSAIKGEQQA